MFLSPPGPDSATALLNAATALLLSLPKIPASSGIQNGSFGTTDQASDLDIVDYEHINHFVLKMSNTIKTVPGRRKDRFTKVDSGKNSPELVGIVKGGLCDEQLYAWRIDGTNVAILGDQLALGV